MMRAMLEPARSADRVIVELTNVSKDYHLGNTVVHAVRDVSLTFGTGEFAAIAGPSGSGKTTLLNLIGCIDTPTSGHVVVADQDTSTMKEKALTELRLFNIGFIFQQFNLVSVLTAFQNVEFPLLLQKQLNPDERRGRVTEMLDKVGLGDHALHRPSELSGGQRQRVAIARALITRPDIVLADEPTANLDTGTGQTIIDLMKHISATDGTTFIFSTHDRAVMEYAHRIIELTDGRTSS
jgi:putative ABC transport system ATP-binding protein